MTTLRYGTSIILRDPDGSALVEWACDADRARTRIPEATVRAKLSIEPEPLMLIVARDYSDQPAFHWTDPLGQTWVLCTDDPEQARDMVFHMIDSDPEQVGMHRHNHHTEGSK